MLKTFLSNRDYHIKNFFETGKQMTTNVAFTGGNEKANFRVSYTNFDQVGMLDNTDYKKNTLSFNGSAYTSDKLNISASANYVNAESDNMPGYQ